MGENKGCCHCQNTKPSCISLSTSPPAAATAFIAASLSLLLFSCASFSLRAFVFELPLGATPVISMLPSFGVKLIKPSSSSSSSSPPRLTPKLAPPIRPPPTTSRDLRLRMPPGVLGTDPGPRPEVLRTEEMDPVELCRDWLRIWGCACVGGAEGPWVLRIGEEDMLRCRVPEEGARGGRQRSAPGIGGGGGRNVCVVRAMSFISPG